MSPGPRNGLQGVQNADAQSTITLEIAARIRNRSQKRASNLQHRKYQDLIRGSLGLPTAGFLCIGWPHNVAPPVSIGLLRVVELVVISSAPIISDALIGHPLKKVAQPVPKQARPM